MATQVTKLIPTIHLSSQNKLSDYKSNNLVTASTEEDVQYLR